MVEALASEFFSLHLTASSMEGLRALRRGGTVPFSGIALQLTRGS